ncbi:linoleate diol synthase [Thozetella sp. PMI_491]|nr:linoleate diol synthase [Thozetella sp. PMI_491]
MASQLGTLIGTLGQAPPTGPDGKSDNEAAAKPEVRKSPLWKDLLTLDTKEKATVFQALTTLASGKPIDDRQLLLENGVSLLQTTPLDSTLGPDVGNKFITMLYHDLPHPPVTVAGPDMKYRRHDGGNNNPWLPEMGKAGSPYSRSVPPLQPKGPNLPDPELVYEHLLRRNGPFRPHPSGLNRLFFSFATLVIHECFQTNRSNQWINDTSSYVDLSTLYGNTEVEQKRTRTFVNGQIFPDSIASERIMMMPPGVIALLLMFSRNHNTIAESLLSINEGGWYQPWDGLKEGQKKKQDEDIFQTARNINVGFFATIVLKDYVASILNTPRANSLWYLDLGAEIKSGNNRVDRGTGNVVSVEFAVLYHWHAALSEADAEWMEYVFRKEIPDLKSMDDVTPAQFKEIFWKEMKTLDDKPAKAWEFGGLKRGPDGKFNDAELGELIKDCIEQPAHAFGAHGSPAALKRVEIMGMLQARNAFNVCTMNEFRRYLNLKEYESFEEWNPDRETARAAELLYGHIDNLELYPGLMAEEAKPFMPGSGLCPGQTTGRGILDDAVALVRGDRFLSYDMNSNTLTNWGISKLGDAPGGTYGGMLPKLLFQGLPECWTGTSTYVLLPFYTPAAAKEILKGNKVLESYDTKRPPSGNGVVGIHTQEGCKKAFEDRSTFRTMYQDAIRKVAAGHEFMIGWDEQKKHDDRSIILHKIFFEDGFEKHVTTFFRETVAKLIKESSLKYPGQRRSIDIVRNVCNVTPILWLAGRFAIPLKTLQQPRGLVTVPQLFDILLVLFIYQGFNILPANQWNLQELSLKAAPVLRTVFEAHLKTQKGWTGHIVDWLAEGSAFEVKPDAERIYRALNATGLPIGDLVGDCMGMVAPVAGNLTQQASLLIDLYLRPEYKQCKDRIVELAHKDDPDSEKELQGYVFEGMRHAGVVPGLPRVATKDVTFQDGARGPIQIKANQTVLIATSKAAMDPAAFPNPEKIDPHRPLSAYTLLGHGMHFCFGARLVGTALTATMKEVFKLKNIRRASGPRGQFSTVEHEVAGVKLKLYLDANSKESPIPTTLSIEYEE